MNKKLRLLAAQCWNQRINCLQFDQEMFAHLIIEECISCVGSQADKVYLKKHFGLPLESDIIYPAVDQSWSVETQYKKDLDLHFPP